MSAPQHNPDFDLDEDLFDFGEVAQVTSPEPEDDLDEILAAFREPVEAEDLLAVPVAQAAARSAPSAPATPARKDETPAAASAARSERGSIRPVGAPAEVAVSLPLATLRSPRGPRVSKGVLVIALAVTLVNSVVGVVVLRSSPPRHDVKAVEGADETAPTSAAPVEETRGTPALAAALPDPERAGTLSDHPALETARDEISHGQYAPARQRVYALLAIIDRVDDGRRESLEAECQFLIAQSLHLEALDRMGGAR